MKRLFAALSLVLLMFSCSHADVILSPTSVVSNSLNHFEMFDSGNLIDQSGLSTTFTSGVTDFSTYIAGATHIDGGNTRWRSQPGLNTGAMVFDLGVLQNIEQVAIWQAGPSITQINGITLATADASSGGFTDVGTFNVAQETGGVGAVFDLTDSTARFVRLTINSNHGVPQFRGFGEIAFEVSAVPEMNGFVCLGLIGLVTVGFNWFKKRRQSA